MPRSEQQADSAEKSTSAEDGYFIAYASFARTLRTWLVAYGVGGPALFLTKDKLADRFMQSPNAGMITTLFLLGVAAQVLAAFVYKSAMWFLYVRESNKSTTDRVPFKIAEWISEAFLLEASFDLTSILLLGWATYLLLALLPAK